MSASHALTNVEHEGILSILGNSKFGLERTREAFLSTATFRGGDINHLTIPDFA